MRLCKFVLIGCLLASLLVSAAYSETTTPIIRPIIVAGMIAAIDLDQGAITLNGRDSTAAELAPIVFYVSDATKIVKDGVPATIKDLVVGDTCTAWVVKTSDGKLVASLIQAKTPTPPVIRVTGKIYSIDFRTSTFKLDVGAADSAYRRLMWFVVNPSTIIRKDGKIVPFGELRVGDLAMVAFNLPPPTLNLVEAPIPALVVDARSPQQIVHAVGKLIRIDGDMIAVQPTNTDYPLYFQVTNETRILKLKPVTIKELVIGDMLDVAYIDPGMLTVIPRALEIKVLPNYFRGTIVRIDPLNRTITCQSLSLADVVSGRTITFKVVPETVIIRGGMPARFESLRLRDLVDVKFFRFPGTNIAAGIVARPALGIVY